MAAQLAERPGFSQHSPQYPLRAGYAGASRLANK